MKPALSIFFGALATAEDLRSAGATEVHGSVVDWVETFLPSAIPSGVAPHG